jgi:hypothetical protein
VSLTIGQNSMDAEPIATANSIQLSTINFIQIPKKQPTLAKTAGAPNPVF